MVTDTENEITGPSSSSSEGHCVPFFTNTHWKGRSSSLLHSAIG